MLFNEVVQKLGIFKTHLGYRYLCYGLELAMENEDYLLLITKSLYPDIAVHFKTTPSCVEHNIRNAVRTAWQRKHMREGLDEMSDYHFNHCPSNGEIFSVLVSYCQHRNKKEKSNF